MRKSFAAFSEGGSSKLTGARRFLPNSSASHELQLIESDFDKRLYRGNHVDKLYNRLRRQWGRVNVLWTIRSGYFTPKRVKPVSRTAIRASLLEQPAVSFLPKWLSGN